MTATELPMFILLAQKRALRRPDSAAAARDATLRGWVSDEEGFQARWGNKRPDVGTRRSRVYKSLADEATRLNNAQIQSGFLDWLYVVDLDAPVHVCGTACATHPDPKEAR